LELWAGQAKLEPLAKALDRSIVLERAALAPSTALDRHGDADSVPPDDTVEAQGAQNMLGSAIVHRF
jgi:hypothetical protein